MFASRRHLLLLLLTWISLMSIGCLAGKPEDKPEETIKEDVIEIENKTQKVIRVSPHELPLKQDRTGNHMNSELFQIQTLRPGSHGKRQRQYVDSKRMRPARIPSSEAEKKAAEAAPIPHRV
ncbi:uncharacterized protein LOC6559503 isoform X2 [Drosophila grimshawi]|uniref:uncharacterized protein LOC6559503 isoform X2 n=1 Tax=Drosophila grimshawi TaxID=7222 RepID=UPI000C86ED5F|nr:uncharacterized protein LOC6559503 isoform X2 [Drosophila grimshawi]